MIQPRTTPPIDWPRYLDQARSLVREHGGYAPAAAVLTARLGRLVSRDTLRAAILRYEERDPGIKHPDEAGSGHGRQDGAVAELAANVQQAKPVVEFGAAPAVHTSKSRAENYLIVPDLQCPFHLPDALEFCERVRREFSVPKENILFTGDEADNFHGKGLDKPSDPDAGHTPRQELAATIDELKRWYEWTGGRARLARSNHGTRYERRAADAEISSQWMRLYRDVIEAPPGWEWKDRWIVNASKQPFVLEHGHEGKANTEQKVVENGYSTVHGHFTKAQIVWVSNHLGRRLWGMCAAALIDFETYAFKYARKYPRRPDNGVSLVLDGGRIPVWVPYG